jgi:pyruvate formate lyase activating enzyme
MLCSETMDVFFIPNSQSLYMKEALFYEKTGEQDRVKCVLCPRFCVIAEGNRGFCRTRENVKGSLYAPYYGKPSSVGIDPIEKKPFFHFAPGSLTFSIATIGCNLACSFCQNWELSHPKHELPNENIPPERVVEIAKEQGAQGIAYTYTEPTIFYEYALDTMKLARKAGLYNVWVSNGYTSPEPVRKAARYMDAINVDLKGDIQFYKELCSVPDEDPAKEALKIYKKGGVFIEITNLVIPGYNDSPEQVRKLVEWVKKSLGPDTPIHFSRFHPQHRLTDVKPTPVKTLERAHNIARKAGMKWVYVGNVPGHVAESTHCPNPKCGKSVLIERTGFESRIASKTCPKCRSKLLLEGKKWISKS